MNERPFSNTNSFTSNILNVNLSNINNIDQSTISSLVNNVNNNSTNNSNNNLNSNINSNNNIFSKTVPSLNFNKNSNSIQNLNKDSNTNTSMANNSSSNNQNLNVNLNNNLLLSKTSSSIITNKNLQNLNKEQNNNNVINNVNNNQNNKANINLNMNNVLSSKTTNLKKNLKQEKTITFTEYSKPNKNEKLKQDYNLTRKKLIFLKKEFLKQQKELKRINQIAFTQQETILELEEYCHQLEYQLKKAVEQLYQTLEKLNEEKEIFDDYIRIVNTEKEKNKLLDTLNNSITDDKKNLNQETSKIIENKNKENENKQIENEKKKQEISLKNENLNEDEGLEEILSKNEKYELIKLLIRSSSKKKNNLEDDDENQFEEGIDIATENFIHNHYEHCDELENFNKINREIKLQNDIIELQKEKKCINCGCRKKVNDFGICN